MVAPVTVSIKVVNGPYRLANGQDVAHTLADLRQRFGGDEGILANPYDGTPYHISLKPWAHANPQTTRLMITFSRDQSK